MMLFLSLLSTIVFQPIISDRSIYEKPLIDAVVIESTGQIITPLILSGKAVSKTERKSLLLVDSRAWRVIIMLLEKNMITIPRTPVRIAHGDRWAVFGGAIIEVIHNKKLFSVKDTLSKGEIYWSEWVKKRKDLPDFPFYSTWDIDVPGSELDYRKKVVNTLHNINATLKQDIKLIKRSAMEAQYFKTISENKYIDLGCKEAKRTVKYKSDKHFKDCAGALDDYNMWFKKYHSLRKLLDTKKSQLKAQKEGIVEVTKKGLKDK